MKDHEAEEEEDEAAKPFVAGENPMRDSSDVFSAGRTRREAEKEKRELEAKKNQTSDYEMLVPVVILFCIQSLIIIYLS